ncbi:hypothetical protein [Pseudomonas asplenii]|uniref:hypothetical protein n=1 Tax=Pseudomonas asplenii TaxID=53407 RepID=UPI0012FD5E9A|nr:hypothetical protein [Pseudomonas fuscovaginae]
MLKLNRMDSAVGYAAQQRQPCGIGLANPYNVHLVAISVTRHGKDRSSRADINIATVSPDSCSSAPNGQYFVVNQQLGATPGAGKDAF